MDTLGDIVGEFGTCTNLGENDSRNDIWFSDDRMEKEAAKEICRNCTANNACAVYIRQLGGVVGVNAIHTMEHTEVNKLVDAYEIDPEKFIAVQVAKIQARR